MLLQQQGLALSLLVVFAAIVAQFGIARLYQDLVAGSTLKTGTSLLMSELPHEHSHLLVSGGAEGLNIYTKGDVRSAASKDIHR